jgi:putative transcriptional regulator
MDQQPGAALARSLLVAAPPLLDPNFDATVVAMLEHSPDGALGVVLNRPLDLSVADVLPGWEDLVAPPRVLFAGGPVGDGTGVAVAVSPGGELEILDLNVDPADVELGDRRLRIFLGFAGWGAGQLEGELAASMWIVLPPDPLADIVGEQPESLWRKVLRRQGGEIAWLANSPRDPSLN